MEEIINDKIGITVCAVIGSFYILQSYTPDNIYIQMEKRFIVLTGSVLAGLVAWTIIN